MSRHNKPSPDAPRMLTTFPPRTRLKIMHAPAAVRLLIEPPGSNTAWALDFDAAAWRKVIASEQQAMSKT